MNNDKREASQGASSADMASWRPGSEPEKAKDVASSNDFGASVTNAVERDYVSRNTKLSDPGASQPRSGEDADGVRVSGAGGINSGPGSSSGGDVDTDIIGLGDGGTLSASGPDDEADAADLDPDALSSDAFASGGRAEGRHSAGGDDPDALPQLRPGQVVQRGDDLTLSQGVGADASNNPDREDDSFAGEVSASEASGGDAPIAPGAE